MEGEDDVSTRVTLVLLVKAQMDVASDVMRRKYCACQKAILIYMTLFKH